LHRESQMWDAIAYADSGFEYEECDDRLTERDFLVICCAFD
jgi:hypothetical protein